VASSENWIKQRVKGAPGYGDVFLDAPLPGFITMGQSPYIENGDYVVYFISDGNNKERGIGVYDNGVLYRFQVEASLSSGVYSESPVTGLDLSADAIVSLAPSSFIYQKKYATLYKTTDQTITEQVWTSVLWQAAQHDTGGFFNPSDNTKLTVPLGVSWVRVSGRIQWTSDLGASAFDRYQRFLLNGALLPGLGQSRRDAEGTSARLTSYSAPIKVSPGDYFEMQGYSDGHDGYTYVVDAVTGTFFSIEAIV